jgi:hypothetical protein
VIDFIHEAENIAARYGLKISELDATDVTLMVRMEIVPTIFIQVYRNVRKNKLSMALVLGNNRIYGVDGEGGILHEHPMHDPSAHLPMDNPLALEEFILKSLKFLQSRDIL